MLKIDIISGFLGAGKTTFIKKLLQTKIKDENVVLIENEFGQINIDSDFLSESKVNIKEISQGCICCSLIGDFTTSLNEIISKYHPDRIIIEPSGVGKLSDIVKAVIKANLGDYINNLICMVDATKAKLYKKNFGEFFIDQIKNAKTVILSRTDVCSSKVASEAVSIVREENEDCILVTTPISELTEEGLLDCYNSYSDNSLSDMLDELKKEIVSEHDEHKHHHHEHDDECECGHHHHNHDEDECECGHHHHNHDEDECECGHHHHDHDCGCGHHHDADEVFISYGFETPNKYSLETLKQDLTKLANSNEYGFIVRAKGIVNTDNGFKQFNITPNELDIEDTKASTIGKVCVIGTDVDKEKIASIFGN